MPCEWKITFKIGSSRRVKLIKWQIWPFQLVKNPKIFLNNNGRQHSTFFQKHLPTPLKLKVLKRWFSDDHLNILVDFILVLWFKDFFVMVIIFVSLHRQTNCNTFLPEHCNTSSDGLRGFKESQNGPKLVFSGFDKYVIYPDVLLASIQKCRWSFLTFCKKQHVCEKSGYWVVEDSLNNNISQMSWDIKLNYELRY